MRCGVCGFALPALWRACTGPALVRLVHVVQALRTRLREHLAGKVSGEGCRGVVPEQHVGTIVEDRDASVHQVESRLQHLYSITHTR